MRLVLAVVCTLALANGLALKEPVNEPHPALSPLNPAEMESQNRPIPEALPAEDGAHPAAEPQAVTLAVAVPAAEEHKEEHPPLKTTMPTVAPTEGSELIDMIVVTPTVRRFDHDRNPAPEQYLVPMVEKLWNDTAVDQRQHVRVYVLNSDKEPELHVEAESLRLHPGVTVFTKNQKKKAVTDAMAGFASLEDGREVNPDWVNWVASENMDAAFLFEKAKVNAPYILFLEDDVFPTTNALQKLSDRVRRLEKEHSGEWLFLDLYTPNLDWAPGMLDVTDGEKYPFQCCTQAMLFKSSNVDGVIRYWNEHPREPIDDNLRNYMRDERPDLAVFAARPNLFQHVGAYSSNADKSFGVVEHDSLDFVSMLL